MGWPLTGMLANPRLRTLMALAEVLKQPEASLRTTDVPGVADVRV